MGRSIAFDIAALDRASDVLEEVGDQVAEVGRRIDRASGTIEIDADAAQAQAAIKAVESQLSRLEAKRLKVDADTAQAERQLQILLAERDKATSRKATIEIDAKVDDVRRKIEQLKAERIAVDADTTAAEAKLTALSAKLRDVNGKDAKVTVDANIAPALVKISMVSAAMSGLSVLGLAAVGAVAGVGAVAAVGVGTAVAGFSGIGDAMSALEQQQKVLAAGSGATAAQIEAANKKVRESFADLGPAAQSFATYMQGFVDGPLKSLRQAGQEAFLPGIQAGLKAIEPTLRAIQPAFVAFAGSLGQAIGGLMQAFAPLAKPFLEFANAALQGLAPLQPVLQQFATQLGAVLTQLVQSGAAKAAMEGLVQIIGALLPIIPPLVDAGTQIMAALGPALGTVVQSLVQAFLQLLPPLVQMAPLFAQWLTALAPLLPQLGQLIASVLQLMIAFAPLSIQLVNLAVTILGPVVGAIASLISWVTTKLTPEFQRWGTFFEILTGKIRGGFDGLVAFVGGIPGRISGALSRMWDPLWNTFRTVINKVVDGWNRLGPLSIPSVTIPGLGQIGGGSLSLPKLPRLATGGIVTGPTLALLGDNRSRREAVVPLERAGEFGFGGGGQPVQLVFNGVLTDQGSIARGVAEALRTAVAQGLLPPSVLGGAAA